MYYSTESKIGSNKIMICLVYSLYILCFPQLPIYFDVIHVLGTPCLYFGLNTANDATKNNF